MVYNALNRIQYKWTERNVTDRNQVRWERVYLGAAVIGNCDDDDDDGIGGGGDGSIHITDSDGDDDAMIMTAISLWNGQCAFMLMLRLISTYKFARVNVLGIDVTTKCRKHFDQKALHCSVQCTSVLYAAVCIAQPMQSKLFSETLFSGKITQLIEKNLMKILWK